MLLTPADLSTFSRLLGVALDLPPTEWAAWFGSIEPSHRVEARDGVAIRAAHRAGGQGERGGTQDQGLEHGVSSGRKRSTVALVMRRVQAYVKPRM